MKKDKSEKIHWLEETNFTFGNDEPPMVACEANMYAVVMTYDKKKVTCPECLMGRAALLRRDERKKK